MSINMSQDDINRTYYGCWLGKRKRDGSIEPIQIAEAHSSNELRYVGAGGGSIKTIDINHPSLVLSFPDSGVYQVSEGVAAYVSRRAERQWHRGIRERALRISGGTSRFSNELVQAMLNPSYTELQDALAIVRETGNKSVALSRNFWLRSMRTAEYPLIYFRDRIVGEIRSDTETVIPNPQIQKLYEEVIGNAG